MTPWPNYTALVDDAMRSVVLRVLDGVAQQGLPDGHALYLGFRTAHPEVLMPAFLRDSYPEEMVIVLDQQFWDLEVGMTCFGVTLRFNQVPYGFRVPFAALTFFADKPVEFLIRFEAPEASPSSEVPRFGPRRIESSAFKRGDAS